MKQYSIKNPPELPASCPPLPAGQVHLGQGQTFKPHPDGSFWGHAVDSACPASGWVSGEWAGDSWDHYAAPEGSEIVRLNFGEPLGSWADELPREYVDLAVAHHRAFPNMRVTLQHDGFSPLFAWDDTPEGFEFWEGVEEFIVGASTKLPPIPSEPRPAQTPEPAPAAPTAKPLTTAEQVRRIEKKLEAQDVLLASIQKLIADFNASNS